MTKLPENVEKALDYLTPHKLTEGFVGLTAATMRESVADIRAHIEAQAAEIERLQQHVDAWREVLVGVHDTAMEVFK